MSKNYHMTNIFGHLVKRGKINKCHYTRERKHFPWMREDFGC